MGSANHPLSKQSISNIVISNRNANFFWFFFDWVSRAAAYMQNRNPESFNFLDDGGADLESDTTVDDGLPASKGLFCLITPGWFLLYSLV